MVVEELDRADADHMRAADLLLYPQRARFRRGHARDTGLALGREQVGDVFPLPGPAGHGGGDAVFEIVGMSHHGNTPIPVLRHCLHPPAPLTPSWPLRVQQRIAHGLEADKAVTEYEGVDAIVDAGRT